MINNTSIKDHVDNIVSKQMKDLKRQQLTSSEILQQIEEGVPHHLLGMDDEYIRDNTGNIDYNNNNNDTEIHELMKQPPVFKSLDIHEVNDPSHHDESKWDTVIKDRMKGIDLTSILGLSTKNTKNTNNLSATSEKLMRSNKITKSNNKTTINVEESVEIKLTLRENWMKKMEEEGLKKARAEAGMIKIKLEAEYKEKARIESDRFEKMMIEQEKIDKEREEQDAAAAARTNAYETERQNIIAFERSRIEKEQEEKQRQIEEERQKLIQERGEKDR